jgi:hypothetical protein
MRPNVVVICHLLARTSTPPDKPHLTNVHAPVHHPTKLTMRPWLSTAGAWRSPRASTSIWPPLSPTAGMFTKRAAADGPSWFLLCLRAQCARPLAPPPASSPARRSRSPASSCSRGPPRLASPLPDDSSQHRPSPGSTDGDPFPATPSLLYGRNRHGPDRERHRGYYLRRCPAEEGDLWPRFASWDLCSGDGWAARRSSPSALRPAPHRQPAPAAHSCGSRSCPRLPTSTKVVTRCRAIPIQEHAPTEPIRRSKFHQGNRLR